MNGPGEHQDKNPDILPKKKKQKKKREREREKPMYLHPPFVCFFETGNYVRAKVYNYRRGEPSFILSSDRSVYFVVLPFGFFARSRYLSTM